MKFPEIPVWAPGMPMNETQEYLRMQNKPWSIVAMAADKSPPFEVAQTYDHTYDAEGRSWGPEAAKLREAHRAPVERGLINPPEAPDVAPRSPEEMPPPMPSRAADARLSDDLDHLERDALKGEAVRLGLIEPSSKYGAERIRDLIREHRRQNGELPRVIPALPDVASRPSMNVAAQATQAGNPTLTRFGTLYVNALPQQQRFLFIDQVMNDLGVAAKLREQGVENFGLLDFGKGGALLSSAVEEAILGGKITGNIVVDTRSREAAAVLSVLIRYASEIVRGF